MAKRPKSENQALREKVKCVEEIRDTIIQAWDTAGLINEYVNFQMLATSAAAVVVNIIEEAIREDEKRRK